LWIGPRLGRVERACLRSVIRQGHTLDLYCYAPVEGVPEGVTVRDAAEILPESAVVRHAATGSVALFSNRFRYELQRRGLGTWLDSDVYLLRPLDGSSPYLLGRQDRDLINTAVLRVPPDSPLLSQLLDLFEERRVPDWLSRREKWKARWRRLVTGRTGLSEMPWGSLGPNAMSVLVKRFGLAHHAQPADVFYPVHWRDADWIRRPDAELRAIMTGRTAAIHLWNERIKHFKEEPAPEGSFLARLHAEGA
jgi:hypothetical protein